MKPLRTRFLTVLITLAFLGFSVIAIAKGKPTNFPDYDVLMDGAVSGESSVSWGTMVSRCTLNEAGRRR